MTRRPKAATFERRGLKDAEYKALGDFRRALREFLAFSDQAARLNGMTPQQHQALLAIRSHVGPEAISIGELAQSLMIRNHSAVGLTARLVERGLVRRAPSPDDRRRVLLRLEPQGAELLERIALMNLGEYRRLASILSQVLRRVRAMKPDALP
jgi:DNA-binding MarR family transcriptional regulator